MKLDNSWRALVNPGAATEYFNLRDRIALDLKAGDFCPRTAWWLAELSRLLYRKAGEDPGSDRPGPSRQSVLADVGLMEAAFLNHAGTQCAIVVPDRPMTVSFVVVVFRGTDGWKDWSYNLQVRPVRGPGISRVHHGFQLALDAIWNELDRHLDNLNPRLFFTGHSLGGALAMLAAARRRPTGVYTYGAPRVGDRQFSESLRDVRTYRIVNHADLVTRIPPRRGPIRFQHAGRLVYLSHDHQMHMEPSDSLVSADRRKIGPLPPNRLAWRSGRQPPPLLSDHAPINYVAQLERHVRTESEPG